MRLFLIRHGETVDNVAQLYAGSRDSPLTNHGVLQAMRLGSYLASTDVKISKIFSSDLQRAFKTGEYIRLAQSVPLPETTKLKLLREQDFGSFEGKAYSERPRASDKQGQDTILENLRSDPDFKDVEPKKSMILRMKTFIDSYLTESFERGADEDAVAVIAHGVILSFLWRGITERFEGRNIVLAPNVMVADRGMGLKYLGGWANTGYMELEIQKRPVNAQEPSPASGPQPSQPAITHNHVPEQQDSEVATELASPTTLNGEISLPSEAAAVSPTQQTRPGFKDLLLVVKTVNCRDHLRDLKKARGGIGSLQHDEKQTTMDSFIKRRKVE